MCCYCHNATLEIRHDEKGRSAAPERCRFPREDDLPLSAAPKRQENASTSYFIKSYGNLQKTSGRKAADFWRKALPRQALRNARNYLPIHIGLVSEV